MEAITENGRDLRRLVLSDAKRVVRLTEWKPGSPRNDDEELKFIVDTYESVLRRMLQRRGYPRLYRCAWKLLIQCVQAGDWDTMRVIHNVFRVALADEDTQWLDNASGTAERVSVWHLKAVLYCWAYLVDARELGQDSAYDAALLEPGRRRADPEARQMLKSVASIHCFLNMTPEEAHQRIDVETQVQHGIGVVRPYLFRTSTTLPGTMALTFVSLGGAFALDMRVTVEVAMLISGSRDLYADLTIGNMSGQTQQRYYDVDQMAVLVQNLFGKAHYNGARVTSLLVATLKGGRVTAYQSVVDKLRQTFWNGVRTRQAEPLSTEERLGLTKSYTGGYASLFAQCCFTCRSCMAQIEEPLNMQVYCSQECYDKDFDRCY